jgi:hypothetical protein
MTLKPTLPNSSDDRSQCCQAGNSRSLERQLYGEPLVSARAIRASRWSVTGLLPSRKTGRMTPFESTLERDFATLLEFSPEVASYESQPLRLPFEAASGRRTVGYPDFLVKFHPGYGPSMLVDTKFRTEIRKRWRALKPRFKAAMKLARERGWIYRIRTERNIRTTYLRNARFLLPYLRCAPDPAHEEILMERLNGLGVTTVAELLHACAPDEWSGAILIPTLWCLVGRRNIATTLDEPIGLKSVIWDPPVL